MITGATGFIGEKVVEHLLKLGHEVRACSRTLDTRKPSGFDLFKIDNLSENTKWNDALNGIDVVIHTAARVHIMDDSAAEPLTEFRKVNTKGTLALAEQAAEYGVKRFIFISSVKVSGEETEFAKLFKENDEFIPSDPYGLSKYEAEQGLIKLAKETDMEVIIIRPPLVYGPSVKANFATMMSWVNKRIPLPFGAVQNKRSFVAIENLVSFIIHCMQHPKAANEVFLISDGEDVSTTELLRKVATAFGKKPLLLSVPVRLMTWVAKLLGKQDVANRLFGSLQVDSSKAHQLLGWEPVITMDEQLKKIADVYLTKQGD